MKVEVKITDDDGNIRQYFVNGILPTEEEIIKEAKLVHPVIIYTHPGNIPYVGTQNIFIEGAKWALDFVQGKCE